MNRNMLITVMSLIVLIGTYIATCIILPESKSGLINQNINDEENDTVIYDAESYNMQSDSSGADNAEQDNKNSGHIVVIDPGHGGADPGAESAGGLKEKNVNLDISLKLQKKLSDSGYNVIMTRTTDVGLYSENDSNKKSSDMKKRVNIINNSGAELAISIHQNSFNSDSSVAGFQAMYNSNSKESKDLAELIYKNFKENIGSSRLRNVQKDNSLYILKNSKVPISLVECGFLTNAEEARILQSDEYQENLTDVLYNAITQYFEK